MAKGMKSMKGGGMKSSPKSASGAASAACKSTGRSHGGKKGK